MNLYIVKCMWQNDNTKSLDYYCSVSKFTFNHWWGKGCHWGVGVRVVDCINVSPSFPETSFEPKKS